MANDLKIFWTIVITLASLAFGGCAGGLAGGNSGLKKVGMHIDAILEFAVEHPLAWSKTRQQNRETGWGQVRWADPAEPEIQLAITSEPLTGKETELRQRLAGLVNQFAEFEIKAQEETSIAGSPALYATGQTAEFKIGLYLLNSASRGYTIRFSAPQSVYDDYAGLLDKILQSFIILETADETSRSD